MLASELDYELPEALIAQHPPNRRDGARLLVVGESLAHRSIADLPDLLPSGALMVLNDTRVMKARVFAERTATGGKVELLFLDPHPTEPATWQVMARSNRPVRTGDKVQVADVTLEFGDKSAHGTRWLHGAENVAVLLDRHGHVPLPPYVRRPDQAGDEQRYQTVFARHWGSAAAPTAGLHLTEALLATLAVRNIELGFVTLHVGAGTFRPVTAASLCDHPMHTERYQLTAELVGQLARARERGAPVVAVGTTVVRALEAAAADPRGICPGTRETDLLIAPGYAFRVVDSLLTNFHAPRSTLLALVFAFAGKDRIRQAYADAVREQYRFLSYGDAMWIPTRQN
jgi:S-adenosylmethionine:tRNA ribosyltransferase-isomerase